MCSCSSNGQTPRLSCVRTQGQLRVKIMVWMSQLCVTCLAGIFRSKLTRLLEPALTRGTVRYVCSATHRHLLVHTSTSCWHEIDIKWHANCRYFSVICTAGIGVNNFRQVADTLEFGMQAQVRLSSQPWSGSIVSVSTLLHIAVLTLSPTGGTIESQLGDRDHEPGRMTVYRLRYTHPT